MAGLGAFSYNPVYPQGQAQLLQIQQQQALAQQLMEQGNAPIQYNPAGAISPLQGVNKIAQNLLAGYTNNKVLDEANQYSQNYANQMGNAFAGPGQQPSDGTVPWTNPDTGQMLSTNPQKIGQVLAQPGQQTAAGPLSMTGDPRTDMVRYGIDQKSYMDALYKQLALTDKQKEYNAAYGAGNPMGTLAMQRNLNPLQEQRPGGIHTDPITGLPVGNSAPQDGSYNRFDAQGNPTAMAVPNAAEIQAYQAGGKQAAVQGATIFPNQTVTGPDGVTRTGVPLTGQQIMGQSGLPTQNQAPSGFAANAPLIQQAAQQRGVDPATAIAFARTENAKGDPNAVSSSGAIGQMQLMPGTAQGLGVNPHDNTQNINGGVNLIGQLTQKYHGNETLAAMAYNWNPTSVDKWLKSGANPSAVPLETQNYIARFQLNKIAAQNQMQQGQPSLQGLPPQQPNPPAPQAQADPYQYGGMSMPAGQGQPQQPMPQQGQPQPQGQPVANMPQQPPQGQPMPQQGNGLTLGVPLGKEESAKTYGEDTAKTAADSVKTLQVMQANLPTVLQRFQQMSDASKDASYGFAVNEEGDGFKQTADKQIAGWTNNKILGKTATANSVLQQRAAQGILPELGPQLAQAGIRGNKFLETLASSASGMDLSASPAAKQEVINGLKQQYIQNLKSTSRQVRMQGGNAPTEDQIDAMVNNLSPQKANPVTPVIKQIGGKSYINQNGQWFEQ